MPYKNVINFNNPNKTDIKHIYFPEIKKKMGNTKQRALNMKRKKTQNKINIIN